MSLSGILGKQDGIEDGIEMLGIYSCLVPGKHLALWSCATSST